MANFKGFGAKIGTFDVLPRHLTAGTMETHDLPVTIATVPATGPVGHLPQASLPLARPARYYNI
jgi:hypothetical protein